MKNTIDYEKDLMVFSPYLKRLQSDAYKTEYSSSEKWYYVFHLNKNNVLELKCYDSDKNVAQLTPHTAFYNPKSVADAPQKDFRGKSFDIPLKMCNQCDLSWVQIILIALIERVKLRAIYEIPIIIKVMTV